MTTPQDNGGPAQTQPQEEYMAMMREANSPEAKDRNLRDWFAGMALQGVIAKHPTRYSPTGDPIDMEIALGAYDYADAMLAARKGDA